jgi:hypothetical protein
MTAATVTHAKIGELLEAVFSTGSTRNSYEASWTSQNTLDQVMGYMCEGSQLVRTGAAEQRKQRRDQ